jgi:regulator of nucleoside diphosphate kinase
MNDLRNRSEDHIIITDADRDRLLPVVDHHGGMLSESLESELQRAIVVAQRDVPADVVSMNREVVFEDGASGTRRTVRVVYPKDADAAAGRVSILAPVGAALLGLRVGQEITWRVANGLKRLRVVEMRYQPEAAGDLAL